MTIEKILEYVDHTPNNTNPNVLSSMIKEFVEDSDPKVAIKYITTTEEVNAGVLSSLLKAVKEAEPSGGLLDFSVVKKLIQGTALVGASGNSAAIDESDTTLITNLSQLCVQAATIMKGKALEYDIAQPMDGFPSFYSATFDSAHPCGVNEVKFEDIDYYGNSNLIGVLSGQIYNLTYDETNPIFVDSGFDSQVRLVPAVWFGTVEDGEVQQTMSQILLSFEVPPLEGESKIAGVRLLTVYGNEELIALEAEFFIRTEFIS